MINWENVKTESIANINDIVDNAGAVLLNGLTETKLASVDLQKTCQSNLDNYNYACNHLGEDQDDDIITKAQTFIDS